MPIKKHYDTLRLVLGDQLDIQHSWFSTVDASSLIVIAEVSSEATYVKHHVQKLCAFFAAMEAFAGELQAAGHHVLHLTLDDTAQFEDFPALLVHLCQTYGVKKFCYQRADEYRLQKQLSGLALPDELAVASSDTEHFMLPFNELEHFVKPAQHNRMETFYRKMRKRFVILMDGDKPQGEKWNYDSENREKLKPGNLKDIPEPLLFGNDVKAIRKRIDAHKIHFIGHADDTLLWPVTRAQSLELLSYFCRYCLPFFGRFQDAMTKQHPHQWSLYHSRLSFSLNSKLIRPAEVIDAALAAYEKSAGAISLAQIEGFVRQILGWREYIRAVYWVNMPGYSSRNELGAQRPLPSYFWTGRTNMACMAQAIGQSLQYAYAHHIQRLMITGNFCLLTGVEPQQVDDWYLGIYIDAIEWVELPNTRGMSQFADGGLVATKPYASGGNYINKMSDYCKNCHYSVKDKTSEQGCPFNSLYWGFMLQHRERLANNPRIGMIYRSWDKQDKDTQQATLARAQWCKDNLEAL